MAQMGKEWAYNAAAVQQAGNSADTDKKHSHRNSDHRNSSNNRNSSGSPTAPTTAATIEPLGAERKEAVVAADSKSNSKLGPSAASVSGVIAAALSDLDGSNTSMDDVD